MGFVQVVLTDDHVALLREGVGNLVVDPEGEPDRAAEVYVLESFIDSVAQHPEYFPVTGRMATSIKHRVRLLKGPSQPQSRRNKRKARQERRMSTAKRRRKERREFMAAYNEARERMEAERLEAEEAWLERAESLAAEPHFNIIGPMGELLIGDVPESMIVPVEKDPSACELHRREVQNGAHR